MRSYDRNNFLDSKRQCNTQRNTQQLKSATTIHTVHYVYRSQRKIACTRCTEHDTIEKREKKINYFSRYAVLCSPSIDHAVSNRVISSEKKKKKKNNVPKTICLFSQEVETKFTNNDARSINKVYFIFSRNVLRRVLISPTCSCSPFVATNMSETSKIRVVRLVVDYRRTTLIYYQFIVPFNIHSSYYS